MDPQPTPAVAKPPHGHGDPAISGKSNNNGSIGMYLQNYLSHSGKAKAPVPISTYSTDAVDHDDYNRHRHNHRRQHPHLAQELYGECLKNHAAALGGHALDGCGEFMPSPSADPALPTSLTCAACGCHRNFHRKRNAPLMTTVPKTTPPLPRQPANLFQYGDRHRNDNDDDEEEEQQDEREEQDDDDDDSNGGSDRDDHHRGNNTSAYTLSSSAPHMLMALSSQSHPPPALSDPAATTHQKWPAPSDSPGGQLLPRKRFRTRFSQEQKEKMHELSEHLGWRLQKRDEAVVEERCREIGVRKGVFKVWMHNNKHNNGTHRVPKANDAPAPAFPIANGSTGSNRDRNDGGQGNGNLRKSNGEDTTVNGGSSSSPSPSPPHP